MLALPLLLPRFKVDRLADWSEVNSLLDAPVRRVAERDREPRTLKEELRSVRAAVCRRTRRPIATS